MGTAAYPHHGQRSADHRLFEREVACYRRQLFPAALRMTGNPDDAEDLIQETLTRAYAGLASFMPGTNARAWLFRIMANCFFSTCRKRRREPVYVLTPELDAPHAATVICARCNASSAPSAEDEALRRFVHSEFAEVLAEMPAGIRSTIYLADVEGYSYRDIADITGVPIGTVMSRLHRARMRVRERFGAQFRPGFLPDRCRHGPKSTDSVV